MVKSMNEIPANGEFNEEKFILVSFDALGKATNDPSCSSLYRK